MFVTNMLKIIFLFCYGSLFGYIFELFFRRFVSQKRWVNPGFLTGPYLPIYGFGVIIMYTITIITKQIISHRVLGDLAAILLIGFFMTLIEYIGGIIFIKGMKIRLWDYSDRWGNIQGIICPLFSLIWTVFGALYYYFIYPYMLELTDWLANNLAFSFVIGIIVGFMIIDAWNTFKISARIRNYAKEKDIIVKYENLKININNRKKQFKQKISMFAPLGFIENFKKELDSYKENEENLHQK